MSDLKKSRPRPVSKCPRMSRFEKIVSGEFPKAPEISHFLKNQRVGGDGIARGIGFDWRVGKKAAQRRSQSGRGGGDGDQPVRRQQGEVGGVDDAAEVEVATDKPGSGESEVASQGVEVQRVDDAVAIGVAGESIEILRVVRRG